MYYRILNFISRIGLKCVTAPPPPFLRQPLHRGTSGLFEGVFMCLKN